MLHAIYHHLVKTVLTSCNSYFMFFCRSTLFVLGAFLDSFQKIADAATNTKGKKNTFFMNGNKSENLLAWTELQTTYKARKIIDLGCPQMTSFSVPKIRSFSC